jgi:hypothetical protein
MLKIFFESQIFCLVLLLGVCLPGFALMPGSALLPRQKCPGARIGLMGIGIIFVFGLSQAAGWVVGVFFFFLGLVGIYRWLGSQERRAQGSSRRFLGQARLGLLGGLFLFGPVAAFFLGDWAVELPPEDFISFPSVNPARALLTETTSYLVTDLGRLVRVQKIDGPLDSSNAVKEEEDFLKERGIFNQFSKIGTQSHLCNCHGLVFTQGAFWLPSEEVPKILEDNGYHPVRKPREGDLVVYQDPGTERYVHTGVVYNVGQRGLILVYSKMGFYSQYIHPHDVHTFRESVSTFYRSSREGHSLRSLQDEVPEVQAQGDSDDAEEEQIF